MEGKIAGRLIGGQVARPYNKIRKVYGLPRVTSSDEIMSKKLNLIPISKYVKERNPYWEKQHILTGYWYVEDTEYKPDEKLERIIEAVSEMKASYETKKEKVLKLPSVLRSLPGSTSFRLHSPGAGKHCQSESHQ